MKKGLFSLREEEIFSMVKELKEFDFVIIGGYAVNAYAMARFSVDCDIVIKDNSELEKIEKVLLKLGYKKEEPAVAVPYSGNFVRYNKCIENNFSVSIDILISRVTDRMTKASFSADWIFENSKKRSLKGKTMIKEIEVNIIDIDALIVMKMVSCRATDIRDVFMMMPNAKNKDWIKSEVSSRYDFKDRLAKIVDKVSSKQFKDGLSGVYGNFDIKTFEKHKNIIVKFQEN
jgi:hypothetical protein